ncbi:MAG TPA: hypothetical protein VHQ02_07295, partial [Usitatibacter sp.]|nr:hypothetical protein [Usitatibacter sp.]
MPYADHRPPLGPPAGAGRFTPAFRGRAARERPPLWEFVVLSMLLHALAIALFGAPSGGSREGRAMWGSLQVVLQGAAPEVVPGLTIERRLEGLRTRPSRERPERRTRTPPVKAIPAAPVPAPAPAAKVEAPK